MEEILTTLERHIDIVVLLLFALYFIIRAIKGLE